jgi:hypothetical protein
MQIEHMIENTLQCDEAQPEKPLIRTKFNISMEKKIERLWQESEKHGWSFSQFVTTALEVLTILHHRNKLRLTGVAPKKKRALS